VSRNGASRWTSHRLARAVNEAMEKSKEMASAKMQSVAAGLGLPPGLV